MLRISTVQGSDSSPILRLEGKLLEPWVDEVKRACSALTDSKSRLHLDLCAVTFVDVAGARFLRELLQRGAAIVSSSGFVAALLEKEES
jgi:hypothetical protein